MYLAFEVGAFDGKRETGLVLVDPKESNLMELGQLREDDQQEGAKVNEEVEGVVPRVETGQKEEDNGKNGEEFSGCRELTAIINLFPMSQVSNLSLIPCFPWRALHQMEENEHGRIMQEVGECPGPGHGENGNGQEREVEE